jgi:methionyl-tRNA formyltransferase
VKKIKIIFFGSDQYSQIVLNHLQEDQRWQIVKNLKEKPDVGILASYGKILTKEELKKPKHGILNIHPSLLPKYRGPTPVPTAILNGDQETGVTIFKIDEKIDHGPIISQFKEEIRPDDNADELLKRLFTAGAQVLTTILPAYLEGKIKPREQDDSQATYTKKLTREDGKINWQEPPAKIERKIRTFYPWPGTWTEVKIKGEKKRLKILKAHLEGNKLILDQVQLEGKNPVSYKQFQEGYPKAAIINSNN